MTPLSPTRSPPRLAGFAIASSAHQKAFRIEPPDLRRDVASRARSTPVNLAITRSPHSATVTLGDFTIRIVTGGPCVETRLVAIHDKRKVRPQWKLGRGNDASSSLDTNPPHSVVAALVFVAIAAAVVYVPTLDANSHDLIIGDATTPHLRWPRGFWRIGRQRQLRPPVTGRRRGHHAGRSRDLGSG